VLLDTTAAVITPERVRFRYRLAGPAQRGMAWLFDVLLRFVVVAIVAVFVTALSLTGLPGLDGISMGVFMLLLFALDWLYGVFFEWWWSGQTPGKWLLQVRVVRTDGSPVGLPDVALRNLLRAADFLPMGFALGVGVMLVDPKQRRLGDLVGGTVVVQEDRGRMLDTVRVLPPVTEEERQQLPAAVPLNAEELATLEDFMRRRRTLSPERAEELAALFAPQVTERFGVVAPTHERVLVLAYARATGKDDPQTAAVSS
jgi:uncharacterized RDD family membrane protein YckC